MKFLSYFCLWFGLCLPIFVSSQSSLRLSDSSKENGDEVFEIVKTDSHSEFKRRSVKGTRFDGLRNLKGKKGKKGKKCKGKKGKKNGKKKGKGKGKSGCFDLDRCQDYSNMWILELEASCIKDDPLLEGFAGCQCPSAQALIDSEDIICKVDQCPDDCEVCKTCLMYVIPECYGARGRQPGISGAIGEPRPPTPSPTPSPTEFDEFDIDKCDTYAGDWIEDVMGSCTGNVMANDYIGCKCPDAQRRVNNGQIDCNNRSDPCPPGCIICEICLYHVVENCMDINMARNLQLGS